MSKLTRLKSIAGLGSRFLIIGGLSTIIELIVFNVLCFGLGMDVVAAKVIASLVALVNAYFGNREWAFKNRDRRRRWVELTLFLAVNGICTAAGAGLVALGELMATGLLQHPPGPLAINAINLISIVIVVVFRFALYHFVVFRVRKVATPDAASPTTSEQSPSQLPTAPTPHD